jgi:hypothetical protein
MTRSDDPMNHSKVDPKGSKPSKPRFYEILDRLAGIEGWDEIDDDEFVRQAREAEPVPITDEEVERAVAQWRAFCAARDAYDARQAQRRHRRRIIAVGFLLLLAAALTIYSVWSAS